MKRAISKTELSEVEKAVIETLQANGIALDCTLVGYGVTRDLGTANAWECDAWGVSITNGKRVELFEYFTGTGLRKPRNGAPKFTAPAKTATAHGNALRAYNARYCHPVTPSGADVLRCLLLDADANSQSFRDWADCYGYDNDSIKARETYDACQRNADKMANVMPASVRESILELLQDY